jgi:hypothetical protein
LARKISTSLAAALFAIVPVCVSAQPAVTGPRDSVQRFYDWYQRNPVAQNRFSKSSWEPVRPLFEPLFFSMIRQEQTKDFGRGLECALDANPFGLGQAGGNIVHFFLEPTVARGDDVVIPVRLYIAGGKATAPGAPPYQNHVAFVLKRMSGRYRIVDFIDGYGGKYQGSLRSELLRMARDPICRWTR